VSDTGSQPGSGTGTAFGARIMRHSSVHLGGLFLVHILTFASALVVAHELGPANFGRFGLLLFFASLITLIFKIATKRGTYMQVFGGDDDDDDDDEEDLATTGDRDRILGNGIFLSIALSFVVTAIVWPFSDAIADLLLGDGADGMLIVWATLAGGLEGVWTLTSNVVRLERRPVSFVLLSSVRPILLLIAVIAFVAAGAGLEGAIAAWAIGTGISAVIAMFAIRSSYEADLDPHIAISIFGRGYVRIPIIVSYWTVGHADKFIVSRFVSPTDLGIYQLASMTAFLLAAVPAAFFKAWRPLKRTMTFAAVDDHYGVGVARGAMLTYFGLTCITALLAVTLFAPAVVKLAPSSFEQAANYIPILAAGALAPYVLRAVNKAGTLSSKRRFYIYSVVASAILFVGLAYLLVPWLGLVGAPLAMVISFGISSVFLFWRSQIGKKPLKVEVLPLLGALALGAAASAVYYAIDPEPFLLQAGLATLLFFLYVVIGVVAGIVPRLHRGALVDTVRSAIRRPKQRFDPGSALSELDAGDRETLRMAVAERVPVDEIGRRVDGNGQNGGERVVHALRRLAVERAPASAEPTEHDAKIGEYLFSTSSVATRDATAQGLLTEGVESADLHALEAVIEDLERAPAEVWN
jgi:O-antigen/teichoic acid export membrane protein